MGHHKCFWKLVWVEDVASYWYMLKLYIKLATVLQLPIEVVNQYVNKLR